MNETDDLGRLADDAVRVDLEERELIVATGADRIRFLHGIVTGDVAGTAVGQGCHSALLTTKGHVVAEMRIFVRPDDVWIVVARGQGEATAAALSRYAIMDDFTAARRADFALIGVHGPAAAARLAGAGVPTEELAPRPAASLAHADVSTGGGQRDDVWLIRARALGADGFWIGGARDRVAAIDQLLDAAGVPRLRPGAAEVARIAAREPKEGAEITPDYFPMEVGLDGAIDYAKGCYLGQEPIVRIRDRGHINWRLVGLEIDGALDPDPRDAIESDTKPKAGRVTSAARLPGGPGLALALLHTSIPAGSDVRIKHGDAMIPARVRE